MEQSKTLFCFSKFPWIGENVYSKLIESLGTRSQNFSPALPYVERKFRSYLMPLLTVNKTVTSLTAESNSNTTATVSSFTEETKS
jgi:hypothetical protein